MLAVRRSEVALRAAMFLVVAVAVFGWLGPQFEREVGLPAIDVDGGVGSPAHTLALMAQYGPLGRRDYLVFLSLDCLLPVTGSLLLLALLDGLARAQSLRRAARRRLALVGALPAVCDLIENTLYALLATLYPRQASVLAQLAYAATVLKLATALGALLLLGLLAARWLRTRLDAQQRA